MKGVGASVTAPPLSNNSTFQPFSSHFPATTPTCTSGTAAGRSNSSRPSPSHHPTLTRTPSMPFLDRSENRAASVAGGRVCDGSRVVIADAAKLEGQAVGMLPAG